MEAHGAYEADEANASYELSELGTAHRFVLEVDGSSWISAAIKSGHLRWLNRIFVMLLIIAILLLILWGGGFAFHVAGGLIHLLLVIALIVFILHFVRGGRGV